jgi:hypothetical protein
MNSARQCCQDDMETLAICAKWMGAIGAILLSPIVLIFAAPFGWGVTRDLLGIAGTPAALGVTLSVSIAALLWTRHRARPAPPRRRHAVPKSIS